MRLPARLTGRLLAAAVVIMAALPGAPAGAGPAPGMCKMDTRRGVIPNAFAIDACFDGSKLVLRNNLQIALTPQHRGDVGAPDTDITHFGLAAIATRDRAGDEVIFLPGDKLTFPIGPGKAEVQVAGSEHGGFYALATTVATFMPGTGAVGAFTDTIKELTDVFEQYRDCLHGKNWVSQLGCRALFVRNVEFATGRGIVTGAAKEALAAVLSGATFTKWLGAQPADTSKRINSKRIVLEADPNAPAALTGSSSCADWYGASGKTRKKYAATVEPGVEMAEPPPTEPKLHAAYMYGFIFGGCDRAKERGRFPANVQLSDVVAGDYVDRADDTEGSDAPLSGASSCVHWERASFRAQTKFAGTVDPGFEPDEPVPTEPGQREAFMFGFISGSCQRAAQRGHDPADVPLSDVLAGEYLP